MTTPETSYSTPFTHILLWLVIAFISKSPRNDPRRSIYKLALHAQKAGRQHLLLSVMTVTEGFIPSSIAAEKRYPTSKKAIRTMAYMLAHACGAGGDMNDRLAEELLDDIETDGDQIYSEKIKKYGENLLLLTRKYGINIPISEFNRLNGW